MENNLSSMPGSLASIPLVATDTTFDNASASKAKPWQLRRIDADHAALSRVVRCGVHSPLPALGSGALLRLELAGENAAVEAIDWSDSLTLRGAFGTLELAQGDRCLRALTGIDVGPQYDDNVEIREWVQSALIARLENTPFAGTTGIDRVTSVARQETCTLQLSIRTEKHAVVTYGRAAPKAWLAWLRQSRWRRLRQPGLAAGLPITLPVRLASHLLPAAELRCLAVGDVIVPDRPAFDSAGEGVVDCGGFRLRVRFQPPALLAVIGSENSMESAEQMADDASEDISIDTLASDPDENVPVPARAASTRNAPPLEGSTSVDALPVTVDFLLGTIQMPLGELRSLGPGTVIPVGGSPSAIAITVSGRVVGRGEAVEVDGKLAIRLTQWSAQ